MASNAVRATEAYVERELADVDCSHDYFHIARVRALAMRLAREEGDCDANVVELAALLHDVRDWKYSGEATAGCDAAREHLESLAVDARTIERVCDIVRYVGFKSEISDDADEKAERARRTNRKEFMVVQDADRLDAIGAIGIGRTFCFGGARNSPMHDPSVPPLTDLTGERYAAMRNDATRPNTVINHFHEKLFKLKSMMKTESGRRLAERRHQTMVDFVERFHKEWNGLE